MNRFFLVALVAFGCSAQAETLEQAMINNMSRVGQAANTKAMERDQAIVTRVNMDRTESVSRDTAIIRKVDAEIARAEAAEAVLKADIEAEAARAVAAEAKEAADRKAADAVLARAIQAEAARAKAAEEALQQEVIAERNRAMQAEGRIESKVDREVKRLDSRIDQERDARIAGDAALLKRMNALDGRAHAAIAAMGAMGHVEGVSMGGGLSSANGKAAGALSVKVVRGDFAVAVNVSAAPGVGNKVSVGFSFRF